MRNNKSLVLFDESENNNFENGFDELIKPYKVIRDPVHGDIWITKIEEAIVDMKVFQHLRTLKQLGPTYFVYPSATHSRFEHSLGTLHMAKTIIEAINQNYRWNYSDILLSSEDTFITRIVALIHDLAHISFGHTLEDEGELFKEKKQWIDEKRRSEILEKQVNPLLSECLRAKDISEEKIKDIQEEIKKILIAEEKGEEAIKDLQRPFIADIVGNTICADLLDYLKRDAYFTGLKLTYDDRIISYFVIKKYNDKPRAAILLERRPNVVRKDILSYCIDLLNLRYSLAERAYYHRVKTIISAMIIKMIDRALRAKIITFEDLMVMGDEVLLSEISNVSVKKNDVDGLAAKMIAEDVIIRKIYDPVYSKFYETSTTKLKECIRTYRDSTKRYIVENYLRSVFSNKNLYEISPVGFVLYLPKEDMGKAALTKTYRQSFKPPVKTLEQLTEKEYPAKYEEIKAINGSYNSLWQFYVLLRKEDHEKLNELNIPDDLIQRVIEDIILEKERPSALVDLRTIFLEKQGVGAFSNDVKQETIDTLCSSKYHPYEDNIEDIDKLLLQYQKSS